MRCKAGLNDCGAWSLGDVFVDPCWIYYLSHTYLKLLGVDSVIQEVATSPTMLGHFLVFPPPPLFLTEATG